MPPNSHRLLIDEPPLMVLPSLAAAIGLNEAIVLQQLHYWLGRSGKLRDGRRWVYNSYPDWERQFPFWSNKTIRRTIGGLEERGLILAGNYNASAFDKTKWYTIDYEKLGQAVDNWIGESPDRSGQNDQIEQTQDGIPDQVTLTRPIPEIATEINQPRQQQQDAEELLLISQVADELQDVGVSPKTARELAEDDPDLAAAWLDARAIWRTADNPAGLLVAKIRAKEEPPRPRRLRWPR